MGSFSWLKADKLTKVANVAYGKPFKFLIPKEFGGRYIKDRYQGYGYLGSKKDGNPKYDMYELLAFWNKELVLGELKSENPVSGLKEIDKYSDENRLWGINIGCYDDQVNRLRFPLKLVSCSFKGTYEDLETPSYWDPDQGSCETYRE